MQDYFEPLVQKEKLEEKMKSIREMKCRAVTCKTVSYTMSLSGPKTVFNPFSR